MSHFSKHLRFSFYFLNEKKILILTTLVLRMEGRFLEAERFYQDEMNLRVKVLGADSLQVAVTMTHLAGI